MEGSSDLRNWTISRSGIFFSNSFSELPASWLSETAGPPENFWRLGGGLSAPGSVDLLATGLSGVTFVGGDAGWLYNAQTGILKHDDSQPSD
ncbi:hypothetical protein AAFN60_06365 [Roseibacillus persicicus]|uniref:hypothetical protein n=1 Tax=Roseibacillus persicicus TaxID=454148 RepID=UPI00398A6158